VAERFAGSRYSALAIDLLSEEGGTGQFADPAKATAALAAAPNDRFIADLNSGIEELQNRIPGGKLAMVDSASAAGWCGSYWPPTPHACRCGAVLRSASRQPRLSGDKATAVLAFYGALDKRVTDSEPAAKAALERAGLIHNIVVEPDATMRFSTTPDRATTRPPPRTLGGGCWNGLAATCLSGN